MSGPRDYQRSRVYAWENRVVAPRDNSFVAFAEAQGMVNAIWAEMGLLYPPKVEPLPKQAKATVACANRLAIYLPARTPSWCLFHEVSHAMTSTVDGHSDGHGKSFVGIYVKLLARFLRFDAAELTLSLQGERIEIDNAANPIFMNG